MKMPKVNRPDTRHGKLDMPAYPRKGAPGKRKFAEGGPVPFDSDLEGAPTPKFGNGNRTADVEAPKQSFGEAFRAARNAGLKDFSWQGKSYNTKLKEEVAPARPSVRQAPTAAVSRSSAPTEKVAPKQAPASAVARAPARARGGADAINAKIASKVGSAVRSAGSAMTDDRSPTGKINRKIAAAVSSAPSRYKAWADKNKHRSFGEALADEMGFAKGGKVPDPRNNDLTPKSNLPKRQYEGLDKADARKPDPKMVDAAVKRGAIRESAYASGGSVARGGGCASKGKKYRMR